MKAKQKSAQDRQDDIFRITGGMAVFVWGRPRFTADIDVVIELRHEDITNGVGRFI